MLGPVNLFLDTMIWLHHEQPDDLDFKTILSLVESPTIVIPRITIEELDRHKDTHPQRRIKERARRWLRCFEGISSGKQTTLKNGVGLHLYLAFPAIDFGQYGLSRGKSDDILLAAIIQYRSDKPFENTQFYTADATPRIIARQLKIPVAGYPGQRLKEQKDPLETENTELRAELDRMKSVRPVLSAGFVHDGKMSRFVNISIPTVIAVPEVAVVELVEKARRKLPKERLPATPEERALTSALAPGLEMFRSYNRKVDEYLHTLPGHLRKSFDLEVQARLATEICLRIDNAGTAPAEDVDVVMRFPKPVIVLREKPTPLKPLKEPSRDPFGTSQFLDQILDLAPLNIQRPDDIEIKESADHFVVRQKFDRIKHKDTALTDCFILTFSDCDRAAPFTISVTLSAANIIDPVDFELHVNVSKVETPLSKVIAATHFGSSKKAEK